MAASPVSINRPPQSQAHHQQQTHQSTGPIDIDHQGQQGQYRLSFSPGDREQHQQQASAAYSGIVGNAARSIFGSSDDETYLPGNPSPIDSRGYGDQQQYLAHERLASIAQQGQHGHHHQQQQQQAGDLSPSSPGSFHQHHTNGFTSQHPHQYPANTNNGHHHRLSGSQLLSGAGLHHHQSALYSLSNHNNANGLASPIMPNTTWGHSIAAAGPAKRA